MNRKTYVKASKISGQGVFARQTSWIGEPLFFLTGALATREEMLKMEGDGDVLIQVDYENYVIPNHPALFINHSCTPNVGIRDDYTFVALRYLRKDDELTLDYSTTMLEKLWEMDCVCGSPHCRGKITDFDLISEPLRRYYLERDVVQKFIQAELGHQINDPARTAA